MRSQEPKPMTGELEKPVGEQEQSNETETREWGYSIPMPGVRYFEWLPPKTHKDISPPSHGISSIKPEN